MAQEVQEVQEAEVQEAEVHSSKAAADRVH